MIIVATGISGSGRLEYLREVERVSGGRLVVYDVGEMMFQKSEALGIRIPEGKILDLDVFALNYLRAATFEDLLKKKAEAERRGVDMIVSTHTCFRWKKHLTPAFNFYYLNALSPDLYVTIVDNAHAVKARLDRRRHWSGRLSLKEVMVWRDEELFITEMLAQYQGRNHYMIPRNEPPEVLRDIIYGVEKPGKPILPKAYMSYPITHMRSDPGWMEEKDRVKNLLKEAGIIIFDPMAVEEAELLGHAERAVKDGKDVIEVEVDGKPYEISVKEVMEVAEDMTDQTVARDYKLIDQSDMIIVYYPVQTVSPGVLSEINYGYTHNKDVYIIFPHEHVSPFLRYYTTRIFRSVEELVEHLREEGVLPQEGG